MGLAITNATLVWGSTTTVKLGEAASDGDVVYHDGATNTWKKAVNTSLEASKAKAMLLEAGGAGAEVLAQTSGVVAVGAGAAGVAYYVSGTAGDIDVLGGTGTFTCLVGFGIGSNQIRLKFFSLGVAQA